MDFTAFLRSFLGDKKIPFSLSICTAINTLLRSSHFEASFLHFIDSGSLHIFLISWFLVFLISDSKISLANCDISLVLSNFFDVFSVLFSSQFKLIETELLLVFQS